MLGSGDRDVVQLDSGKGMMCWGRAAPAAVTLRRTGFSAREKTKSKTKRAMTLWACWSREVHAGALKELLFVDSGRS